MNCQTYHGLSIPYSQFNNQGIFDSPILYSSLIHAPTLQIITQVPIPTHPPKNNTMTPPLLPTALISAILGITTHLTYFIHADLEKHVVFLANCLIFWPLLGLLALFILGYTEISQWMGLAIPTFHSSLLASIAIYRYFFHALDGFPGPKLARITALWDFKNTVLDAKWYLKVKELHEVYGDVVRISISLYLSFSCDLYSI